MVKVLALSSNGQVPGWVPTSLLVRSRPLKAEKGCHCPISLWTLLCVGFGGGKKYYEVTQWTIKKIVCIHNACHTVYVRRIVCAASVSMSKYLPHKRKYMVTLLGIYLEQLMVNRPGSRVKQWLDGTITLLGPLLKVKEACSRTKSEGDRIMLKWILSSMPSITLPSCQVC